MADYFVAISEDGVRFKLNHDGTWAPDTTTINNEGIRFRSSDWGDSIAKIKAVEGQDPTLETDDFLNYKANVGGFPADMYFYFVNGMFYMSIYSFAQEHADNNKFITDLYALEKLLSTKYGNPFEANEYWLNDRYKDDHAYHGIAVALGHYSIFRSWQDAETTLTLQLTGDNHEIRLSLIYKSTRLQSLAAAKRESDMLDGL